MFSKSEPVDIVTVSNHLKEKGSLEDVGGVSYLARLVDTVPLAVNTDYYAKIIRDKSSLRRLIEKANLIVTRCFDDRGEVDEVINFAEKSIFEISENKIKKSFFHVRDLINGNIDTLEERQGSGLRLTGIPTGYSR
ncbi:MAG: replicative DNA helicase, partial [Deltaproteobacteria bacterium]